MSETGWTLRVGHERDGGRVVVRAREDLLQLATPRLDLGVQIGVPVASGGFPSPEEERELERVQAAVAVALAADGVLIAHATTPGLRRLFVYLASASSARTRLTGALRAHGLGPDDLAERHDPSWTTARTLG